jgi:hypothetical protein
MATTKTHSSVTSFIHKSVKTTNLTRTILKKIYGHFPLSCQVITGHLTVQDTYWRISHYWEAQVIAIDKCLQQKNLEAGHAKTLSLIKKSLEENAPNPRSGYYPGKWPGLPVDKSSLQQMHDRYKRVINARHQLLQLMKTGSKDGTLLRARLKYCTNYIMPPGKSKHIKGYALDITGDRLRIEQIANDLGASLIVKTEYPHLHVEFEKGVTISASGNRALSRAAEAVQSHINSGLTHATHHIAA